MTKSGIILFLALCIWAPVSAQPNTLSQKGKYACDQKKYPEAIAYLNRALQDSSLLSNNNYINARLYRAKSILRMLEKSQQPVLTDPLYVAWFDLKQAEKYNVKRKRSMQIDSLKREMIPFLITTGSAWRVKGVRMLSPEYLRKANQYAIMAVGLVRNPQTLLLRTQTALALGDSVAAYKSIGRAKKLYQHGDTSRLDLSIWQIFEQKALLDIVFSQSRDPEKALQCLDEGKSALKGEWAKILVRGDSYSNIHISKLEK
ncbi:MAG: hypothetical protein AAF206_29440, partial [Bacteroidota bacterium]